MSLFFTVSSTEKNDSTVFSLFVRGEKDRCSDVGSLKISRRNKDVWDRNYQSFDYKCFSDKGNFKTVI